MEDSNVDGDVNEGVKAAEAMVVIAAPSEGGDFVLEKNMVAASVKEKKAKMEQNKTTKPQRKTA